jgi:F0F1-type ATP synthase assembly protein I
MAQKEKPLMAQLGQYLGLAMIVPSCVFVGYAIGYGLDTWLGTTFLKAAFLLVGVVAGFVQLIRDVLRVTGQNK